MTDVGGNFAFEDFLNDRLQLVPAIRIDGGTVPSAVDFVRLADLEMRRWARRIPRRRGAAGDERENGNGGERQAEVEHTHYALKEQKRWSDRRHHTKPMNV